MVSAIPQYKSTIKIKEENNDEGHPDPREVLFLVDPHQMTLEEVRMVLTESLNQIDSQIHFNFIILGLDPKEEVFFHKVCLIADSIFDLKSTHCCRVCKRPKIQSKKLEIL